MKYVSLYENLTESGEKAVLPIYELDITAITPMSITTQTAYQQSYGTVPTCPKNCNLWWAYTQQQSDFHSIFPEWDNMPHVSTEEGSVIRSNSVWSNNDGLYWIADSPLETVTVGQKPDDWNDNWMYYGTAFNGVNSGKTYRIYIPLWYLTGLPFTNLIANWDSTAQYYKNNPSNHDYRIARVFKTDAGFNFGLSALGGNPTTQYWGVLNRRGGGTAPYSGEGAAGDNFPYTFEYCTPEGDYAFYQNTGTSNSAGTVLGYMATDDIPSGGINVYHNQMFIFVHFTYEERDYYGLCLMQMSDNTENAHPTIVRVVGFDIDFWGTSIVDEPPAPDEPYWGDDSTTAGGDGTFSAPSDSRVSGLELAQSIENFVNNEGAGRLLRSYSSSGVHLYLPDDNQYNQLLASLYTSDFLTNLEQSMFNPLSTVLAHNCLPHSLISQANTSQGVSIKKEFTAGGYNVSRHTTLPESDWAVKLADLCKSLHLGSVNLRTPYFGAFPDFAPFTKALLHLPFIGDFEIDINKCMYGVIEIDYICEALGGNVIAYITLHDMREFKQGETCTCVYMAQGNAAFTIPMFADSQSGSAVAKMAPGVLFGGLGTGLNVLGAANTVPRHWGMRPGQYETMVEGAGAGFAGGFVAQSASFMGAQAVALNSKNVQSAGTIGGNLSIMSDSLCWIEIIRPEWANPSTYPTLKGIPSEIGGIFGELGCIGKTVVSRIELDTVDCTDAEKQEIQQILSAGIFIIPQQPEPEPEPAPETRFQTFGKG